LVVVNKKPWCSAPFINTEFIVKLLINRGVSKIQEEKNSVANAAEPTGWPRRRHPEVSSTGTGGAVVSVGWGVTENWAIVLEREVARACFEMRGVVI
jgi:hypothetical protein